MSSPTPLEVLRLGRMAYSQAIAQMEERAKARSRGEVEDALIIVEHEPVLTLGRRADRSNLLASNEVLEARGIDLVQTGRGGDVTYHGPGQVVGYPVISLTPHRKDVKRYVSDLEEVMIAVCRSYGVVAGRSPGQIGCWVEGRRKIGAIGVRISKWVTSHGFAFNVDPRMNDFRLIVPCGIADKPVTSLALELGAPPPFEEVSERCVDAFLEVFGLKPATV